MTDTGTTPRRSDDSGRARLPDRSATVERPDGVRIAYDVYGSGEPTIIETITRGRTNHMPAHKDLLSEAKIHLLTAYVLSLSLER